MPSRDSLKWQKKSWATPCCDAIPKQIKNKKMNYTKDDIVICMETRDIL